MYRKIQQFLYNYKNFIFFILLLCLVLLFTLLKEPYNIYTLFVFLFLQYLFSERELRKMKFELQLLSSTVNVNHEKNIQILEQNEEILENYYQSLKIMNKRKETQSNFKRKKQETNGNNKKYKK